MSRTTSLVCILGCFTIPLRALENPEKAIPPFLGEHPWTSPAWVQVRATSYRPAGKSSCGLKLRCASDTEVGSASVPYWIPDGSIIITQTGAHPRVYLAIDHGRAVESRAAARKGKTDHSAPVIDFCAPRQSWPDEIPVEIYQYVGDIPFQKLTRQQQMQTMEYARRFIAG